MKKKFLESFINSQINYNGDFNKIKKRLIYNYEKKNRKMLFGRKLKLCLYLSGVLILMFFTIIHFPKDVLANVLNYYSVSFDDKMGEKIQQNYYQKGEIVNLPILNRDGYYFAGWKDISNDIFYSSDETEIISIIVNNNVVLEAEWIKLIHDFNGINYKIIVDDKSKYDPFDNSYVKDDKVLRQNHQKLVENEFNIKIIYVEYDPFKDEMDLIKQIAMHTVDLKYYKTNVFAAVLPSKTLSYLGAYLYVADLNEDDEISDKVYGYKNTSNFGEQYMFYNKTKLTELGIEDPLIMWMKGKWTQSNFKAWVEAASEKLLNEEMGELNVEINNLLAELKNNGKTSCESRAKMLKELADLQYVLSGMVVALGLPMQEVFARVHRSNMSKLVNGKVLKRADGKFLKGPNYQPPYLQDIA